MTENHWTEPSSDDELLKWRFCDAEADLGIRSISEAMEAMALAGISGGGNVQTDDRLVRRGICTVDSTEIREPARMRDGSLAQFDRVPDREGAAAKLRRIDAMLGKLEPWEREVLWEAYGPNYSRWREQHKRRLGEWPGVALVTSAAAEMFAAWRAGVAERAASARAALGPAPIVQCRPQEKRCGRCKGSGREEQPNWRGERIPCEACGGAGGKTSARLSRALHGKGEASPQRPAKRLDEVVRAEAIVAASKEDQAARHARMGWLMHEASDKQLERVIDEAHELMWVATNRWRDLRGRRMRVPRHATHEAAMAALDAREEAAGR